ncbi:MAG: GNAT family N-acetyltransferase [Candidatus Sericytochromatia bacterium]
MEIKKLSNIHYSDCEKILRDLPDWFGIESAIVEYLDDIKKMETYGVFDNEKVIGFLTLNYHNQFTAEIHVMGIYKEFHHKNIGSELIKYIENILKSRNYEYLEVKTLSDSHPDINYKQTRAFYFKNGFRPVQEFKELWGEHNPCLLMIKKILI